MCGPDEKEQRVMTSCHGHANKTKGEREKRRENIHMKKERSDHVNTVQQQVGWLKFGGYIWSQKDEN